MKPSVLRSYGHIAIIEMPVRRSPEAEQAPRAMGDLTDETNLAAAILGNWLAVTRHNIGAATTTRLLQAAIDECAR